MFGHIDQLFFDELRDLIHAGLQKARAFEQMAAVAGSHRLRSRLLAETDETQRQNERLKEILQESGRAPERHHCRGMEPLLRGGLDLAGMMVESHIRDIGLVIAARKALHYEIAGLDSIRRLADASGRVDQRQVLWDITDQKVQADRDLSVLTDALCSLRPVDTRLAAR